MQRTFRDSLQKLVAMEQVRYLVVAGTTTLFYVGLLALALLAPVHYIVAILMAQAVTIACAFPAYRTLVFRSRGRVRHDFIRFLGVWGSGMVAGLVATPALIELLGWEPLLAQIVAIAVVAVATYLGHKFISFRPLSSDR